MQIYSLVTRRPDCDGANSVAWSGLYFVQALDVHNCIVGECVCLYTIYVQNYPLYELYAVDPHLGRCIDLNHLQKEGTLLFDDGEELKYVELVSKMKK